MSVDLALFVDPLFERNGSWHMCYLRPSDLSLLPNSSPPWHSPVLYKNLLFCHWIGSWIACFPIIFFGVDNSTKEVTLEDELSNVNLTSRVIPTYRGNTFLVLNTYLS